MEEGKEDRKVTVIMMGTITSVRAPSGALMFDSFSMYEEECMYNEIPINGPWLEQVSERIRAVGDSEESWGIADLDAVDQMTSDLFGWAIEATKGQENAQGEATRLALATAFTIGFVYRDDMEADEDEAKDPEFVMDLTGETDSGSASSIAFTGRVSLDDLKSLIRTAQGRE